MTIVDVALAVLTGASIFTCGAMFGTAWAGNRADRTARTKIALADERADDFKRQLENAESLSMELQTIAVRHRETIRSLQSELAARPQPRKRGANGRFEK